MTLALIALTPFLGALLPALMIRTGRNACAVTAGGVTLFALILLLVEAPAVWRGEVLLQRVDWMPGLGLNATFMLDGLGLFFAGLILGIGLLVILYARFYLDRDDPMGRFYSYLLLFQGAMVGIVLSDNVLMLLIFWELTSLSSFLLIGYWRHAPEGRQGARMALAVTGMGGLAMIGGMLILGDIAGSYDLSVILTKGEAIQASPLYLPALLLILLGCFTKSAQFPFHFWLPHAMAAPTPVSAYLHSATMVKAGIFLMARLWPALSGTPEWFYIVSTTGLVTMVIAAVIALFKDDLKALLAFSTVSHLGLITMLLGFGTPMAATAAVFHILNHATFKAALFMSAGIVDHAAHTRDIRRLGGLRRLMPATFWVATIAALSMAGAPLLNGFLSKEMMLEEAVHTPWLGLGWPIPLLATVGALFSAAYSFRLIGHVFLGPQRDDYPAAPHDPGPGLLAAPALLVAGVVAIGLAPAMVAGGLVNLVADAVTGGAAEPVKLKIWHGLTLALAMSAVALVGGYLLLARYADAVARWRRAGVFAAKPVFDALIALLAALAERGTSALHAGTLPRALGALCVALLAMGFAGWGEGALAGSRETLTPPLIALAPWALLIGTCLAAARMHHDRLMMVLLTSVVGLVVSLGFVYLSAPDLALTQISVEVVTTVLMLLALNFLPKDSPDETGPMLRTAQAGLALVAGLGAAALSYAVMTRDGPTISEFHVAQSYPGGGGTNVVNVILVDFRGFDTFGEIIVLAIAALGIYALLDGALRGPSLGRVISWVPDQERSKDRHPMMLVVATRFLLPVSLVVGLFILLRGHNQPGGGFIAGLVVAIALVMQYVASGYAWTAQRRPMDHHGMIGLGVLVAGLTGAGAWLADRPFLTSAYGYVTLPPLEKFELATAMAFDLGVFLTVVGAVLLALENLSRVARFAEQPGPDEPMDVDPSAEPRTAQEKG
ncbi:monovalent cation/H+ antiporter subunit A [Rubrimonas cliftonensis]|uniref:Multisubunit potassium/proton antiporter, PhaA subunit /multisubunit potassium/proton antiporter, PhaB subunit n=1 Tax=Rubrimonas cliftonensis TaxID=89524 RepID=A0A1H3WNF6_9RHOB|nr:monovalent cation/H+ antiporter subunit A [Rubrimonas cliftonensis]SDZ87892.1 multisubunit potassium/proton antiporter, PhaA subunit /multisubunit potassium/proton antiporter, PhaB subunit [Rubrimonas cliftonensis]